MVTKSSHMEQRNLFEEDRQRKALAAFNTRARTTDWVD